MVKHKLIRKYAFCVAIALVSFFSHAQSRWQNYAAVYFTGNADMYYIGPSFQLGTGYLLNENFNISSYAHYFYSRMENVNEFQTLSLAVLLQFNLGPHKRFYIAAGPAWQRTTDKDDRQYYIDRSIILPAYRMGYTIFIKRFVLCTEICTTGPYTYNNGSTTELFTLPSLGLRLYKRR